MFDTFTHAWFSYSFHPFNESIYPFIHSFMSCQETDIFVDEQAIQVLLAALKSTPKRRRNTGHVSAEYDALLRKCYMHERPITQHVLPVPRLCGKGRVVWMNFRDTCCKMRRQEAHVQTFFINEGFPCLLHPTTGALTICRKGRVAPSALEQGISRYIRAYVECGGADTRYGCRQWSTRLEHVHGVTRLVCSTCNASISV